MNAAGRAEGWQWALGNQMQLTLLPRGKGLQQRVDWVRAAGNIS